MKKESKGLSGFLGLLTKPKTPEQGKNDQPYLSKEGKRYQVVGLKYREANIMRLSRENPLYKLDKTAILKRGLAGSCIHKFLFTCEPAELVQEPDNPQDSNAVKVVVNGQHIGYIKAGNCAHLNKVINEGRVERVLCRIYGGPYKGVFQDTDEALDAGFRGKPTYRMETGAGEIRAEIRVIESP